MTEYEERRHLETLEESQRKVIELEQKIRQKDISLAVKSARYQQNFGSKVDESYGPPPGIILRMSAQSQGEFPLITISDDSDGEDVLRIDEGEDDQSGSSQSFSSNYQSNGNRFQQEHSSLGYDSGSPFAYEHPPDYQSFRHEMPPSFYHDDEVRVDEMPKWPMQDGLVGSPQREEPRRVFTPTPVWRHQQDFQVDPMPVFPMEAGEEEKYEQKRSEMSREDQARIQLRMIKEQAEKAEIQSRSLGLSRERTASPPRRSRRSSSSDHEIKESKERRDQRAVRHEIAKYREKVLEDMRKQEKEKELAKREKEREKRHALKRKQEEEETAKRREARRKRQEQKKACEADEHFLKYLTPAIGDLEVKATRMEGKSPTEYVSKCHAVNIPAELIYGKSFAEHKDEGYDCAIQNYVDKLVSFGVIDKTTRKSMKDIAKLPKFLAELVEPLCNDIAIFGTQISVTDARDLRIQFETFTKEKSVEFWKQEENKKKLADFMRRNERKRTRSRSRSRDRKRHNDRERDRDRDRRDRDRERRSDRERSYDPIVPIPPSHEETLKKLFATVESAPAPIPTADPSGIPSLLNLPPKNFYPQQTLPSLMSIPMQQPQPSYQMDQYMQPTSSFYQQPQQQYNGGLLHFPQPPMMQQPYQPQMHSFHSSNYQQAAPMAQMAPSAPHPAPVAPARSKEDDDAALLDEIYQMY